MPENKASKLRGDLKYYAGVSKEKIGKAIDNEKLKKEGEADKLSGTSEREAALVRQNTKKGNSDKKYKRDEQAEEVEQDTKDMNLKSKL